MSEPEYNGQFDKSDLSVCTYREDKECIGCNEEGVWKISNVNSTGSHMGAQFECTACDKVWSTGSMSI